MTELEPKQQRGRATQEVGKPPAHTRTEAGLGWGPRGCCPDAPSPHHSQGFAGETGAQPLGQPHSQEAGMGRRDGGKGRGSPPAWKSQAGGCPGDLLEGFHWLLEALAASQVLILGYFQPLAIPLCCVCRSSSSYPDPCIVTLPLAHAPALRYPSLPHSLPPSTSQKILWDSRDCQRCKKILTHNHALGDAHLPTGP